MSTATNQILALALQTLDDPSAGIVLEDAVKERGWEPASFVVRYSSPGDLARGIVGDAIFGEWSETMWPVVGRCRCEAPCWRTGRGCLWVNEDDGDGDADDGWTTYCSDCFRNRTYELAEFPDAPAEP